MTVRLATRGEFVEQLGNEVAAAEAQVIEFLGIGEAADAVVGEDEVVASADLLVGDGLGLVEVVLDHLEHDVERRQGEDGHHHAAIALGDLEARAGRLEMTHEGAVEDGLAVLVVADGGPELVLALDRHDRGEEADDRRRMLEVGVEVGAGEAEDGARLIGAGEHRIERHTVGLVGEGEHQRHQPAGGAEPADDVRTLVAIEDAGEDLGGDGKSRLGPLMQFPQLAHDRGIGEGDIAVAVFPGGPDGAAVEDAADEVCIDAGARRRS